MGAVVRRWIGTNLLAGIRFSGLKEGDWPAGLEAKRAIGRRPPR